MHRRRFIGAALSTGLLYASSHAKGLIGKGLVDFKQVLTQLHKLGYSGALAIERGISGP